MSLFRLFLLCMAAAPAFAQQAPGKTTEQQARSYIASSFMTGAAPLILSEDVTIAPELRRRLGVSATADSRVVYTALLSMTSGKPLTVRSATNDEIAKSQAPSHPGRPVFALESGDATLILQYDLERDNVAFVGQPVTPVAVTAPVTAPPPPQRVPDAPPPAPIVEAPKPAPPPPAPVAVETPKPAPPSAPPPASVPTAAAEPLKPAPAPPPAPPPAPAAEQSKPKPPALQVVEPKVPRMVAPGPSTPARAAELPRAQAPAPRLRPSGPCVIKPVMSDQDLVNCGATPR